MLIILEMFSDRRKLLVRQPVGDRVFGFRERGSVTRVLPGKGSEVGYLWNYGSK